MLTLQHPFDLRTIQASRTTFVGYGGIKVTTVQASFGVVPVETVLNGTARAIEVTATSDGRGARTDAWHRGDESGQAVYVERYSDRGREFHGWIDSETRMLVQAG
jgi:hypothetical protein